MKTEHREHPLGTPGGSARLKAASEQPESRVMRFLARLLLGNQAPGRSWEKGAEGEELVAKKLAKLSRERWMPLHDLALGERGRNVDHLVIGRAGVFTVNTKNLTGNVVVRGNSFLVNGFPSRDLYVARDEAARVGERLSIAVGEAVDVTPVVVVLSASLEIERLPEGVHVLGRRDVPSWFDARPDALAGAAPSRVYVAARMNRVWTAPLESLRQEFAAPDNVSLTTKAWTKWGHDRVYVNDASGGKVGYLDRKSGHVHVEDEASLSDVLAALARH
ncbi:MAG TPA: nuclease-related domain-containing protein [Actinomycetota bacterium]|nr:nuclease-related domain-containing protein [Actinomycetota bacterium]